MCEWAQKAMERRRAAKLAGTWYHFYCDCDECMKPLSFAFPTPTHKPRDVTDVSPDEPHA